MTRVHTCEWSETIERSRHEAMSDDEMDALEAHIAECPSCQRQSREAGTMRNLIDELRDARQARDETLVDMAPPMAKLNEVLHEYVIISELGRGGMGVVYKARQVKLNRMVALKVLPALLGAVRPDAMERFKREAALAASLKHSNIISIHDFGEADGTLYYAMELVEGRTLQDLIREMRETGGLQKALSVVESATDASRSRSEDVASGVDSGRVSVIKHSVHAYFQQVALWLIDVADALHFAHVRGVVHRDMKPSNLLLNRDGRLMISDFGLARSSASPSMTVSRALLGTSRYMAPEMIDPSLGPAGPKSDVYALGATLYEMLTFQPMFAGSDDREILNRVQHHEPAPPRSLARQIPRELETICLKAIAKRPEERYATAAELADDLRRWRLDLPIHARRPKMAAKVWRFVRRRKLITSAFAMLLIATVVAVVLATGYWRSKAREAQLEVTAREQRLQLQYAKAEELFVAGQFKESLQLTEQALAEVPDSRAFLFAKARSLRFLGRGTESIAILEDLIAKNKDDWQSHLELSTIYGTTPMESEEKARNHSEQFQRLKPDTPDALWAQAAVESDAEAALDLIDKALDKDPDNFAYTNARVRILSRLGRFEDMLKDAQRTSAMRPGWAFTHNSRASALVPLKRFAEAEAASTRAIELEPTDPRFWAGRSVARGKLGDFTGALADASRAIELDPQLVVAHHAASQARLGIGEMEAALADCTTAINLDPLNPESYVFRLYIYGQLSRWSDLVADATRVIELLPNDWRGYQNRMVGLRALGQMDRAHADATKYVELSPDKSMAYRYRGMLRDELGLNTEAIADLTEAIKGEPSTVSNFYRRANLYLREGHPDLAIADLTRVDELQPNEPVVLRLRIAAYWQLGTLDLALAGLDRMIAGDASSRAHALLWKHVILRQQGDDEAAAALIDQGSAEFTGTLTERILRFLGGGISDKELLTFVANNGERCGVMFYIGARLAFEGNLSAAKMAFAECTSRECRDIFESDLARDWLRRLGQEGARP